MKYNYGYNYSVGIENTEMFEISVGLLFTILPILTITCIITIISMWKIFKKAGRNGWEAIVPIYNIIVLLEISEIPVWQIVFYIIPFANIYIMFKQYIELAKKFGKSTGFGVLTVFFSIICLPILAFGNAKYEETQEMSDEKPSSILDITEEGVPNSSEAKDFTYGYEKEETVIIPKINLSKESDILTESSTEESQSSEFTDGPESE